MTIRLEIEGQNVDEAGRPGGLRNKSLDLPEMLVPMPDTRVQRRVAQQLRWSRLAWKLDYSKKMCKEYRLDKNNRGDRSTPKLAWENMEEGRKVLGEGEVFVASGCRPSWLFTWTEREGAPSQAKHHGKWESRGNSTTCFCIEVSSARKKSRTDSTGLEEEQSNHCL